MTINKSIIRQIRFNSHGDDRGELVALEIAKEIPFDVKRVYYIFHTAKGVSRGFHALATNFGKAANFPDIF